jgi:Zn-dependent protease/predicted transcriptional regulator
MKWALKLGVVSGIPIYVHATFLILVGWVGLRYWAVGQSVAAVVQGVGFILLLFGCVVLHELGHALVAKRYGIRTRDITLWPIGGVAKLDRMPDRPIQELFVAIAGPAVNVVIAGLLFAWLWITGSLSSLMSLGLVEGSVAARLLIVNVILVVFNLLPAFPMDGGRVLRALLAMRLSYDRATQIAAGVGQTMAMLFGFVGLMGNPFLVFIAFFVWMGAAQEAHMAQVKAALGAIPVHRAMITDFRTLDPTAKLSDAIGLILQGSQQDFPVVENDQIVGVLTQKDLLHALAHGQREDSVADAMQRDFQKVNALDMMETAFERLQLCACRTLPVEHLGRLVGLVTTQNLGELLMIRNALTQGGSHAYPWNHS